MRKVGLYTLILPAGVAMVAGAALLWYEKLEIHTRLNGIHPKWADPFFVAITYLGDGLTVVAIVVMLLLIHSYRAGLFVGLSAALSGLLIQFLKRVPFSHMKRPAYYLDEMPDLHIPEGVELAHQFSFPSGHATTAFAAYVALAFIIKSQRFALIFGVLALLVAYSRVWISMHFLEDVLAGSFIGSFTAILMYQWLYSERMMGRSNLDGNLLKKKLIN